MAAVKPQRFFWLLAVFYFVFNCGFLSYNYEFDGTVFSFYLEAVKAGGQPGLLFHSHHLVFEPLGYLFWNALLIMGWKVRSIFGLQFFSLILAGISLAVFANNLVLIRPEKKWLAPVCALGLGFSFAYWFFALQPAELSLALLFLNLGFYAAIKLSRRLNNDDSFSKTLGAAIILAISASLAIFGHIMYGLFLIPILVSAARIFRSHDNRPKIWPLAAVLVTAAGIIGSLYLIGYFLSPAPVWQPAAFPKAFIAWVLGNASLENPFGYRNATWTVGVTSPAQWVRGLAWAFFWNRNAPLNPSLWRGLEILCWSVLAIFAGGYVWKYLRDWSKHQASDDFIMAWVAPGLIFTQLWAADYFEQKLYLFPALWAMVFLGCPWPQSVPKKSAVAALLGLAVAALLVCNFFTKILPDAKPENNPELEIAEQIKQLTEPGALMVISGVEAGPGSYNIGKIYLPYFSNRNTIVLDWALSKPVNGKFFPQNLEALIAGKIRAGAKVYLLSEVWSSSVLELLNRHHRIAGADLLAFWDRFQLTKVSKLDGGFELYRVELKGRP